MPKGGSNRGQGRKQGYRINQLYRRIPCSDIRLTKWVKDALKKMKGSTGRLLEKAAIEYYRLKKPSEEKK